MNLEGVCSICKEFAVITTIWKERGICEVCSRKLRGHVKLPDLHGDLEPIDETDSEAC